ncbi:DUF4262 domain-containing protein [Streptomyces antibioticus]|uniref:DUF4262 domain-containing protein n=1 Tax=Streptomyces antibioticus TaxID=1890 RepID=UPI00224D158B|nr:DUF4262 domain-containing protein [Streptomyces antibioticus]MCX5173543.1 DUF4262 domain-containing protein [Streptomyces antibioticus]
MNGTGTEPNPDRADLTIIENVQRRGWHVVMVPEDEIGPGFAYTIGLAHTYGAPDLAMFGLDLQAMHHALNRLAGKPAGGSALADGQRHPEIVEGRQVALRRVDLRWYRTFFGRAIGFYRRPPFPVLQVAWPDTADRFHWEEQAEERHRDSQPQLWLPPNEHPVGIWTVEL